MDLTMAKKIAILFIGNADKNLKRVALDNGFVIRDPNAYSEGEFVEACDIVAGDAPIAYKDTAEYIDVADLEWMKQFSAEPEPEPEPEPEQAQKPTRKTK
jgi:hypothetical protein